MQVVHAPPFLFFGFNGSGFDVVPVYPEALPFYRLVSPLVWQAASHLSSPPAELLLSKEEQEDGDDKSDINVELEQQEKNDTEHKLDMMKEKELEIHTKVDREHGTEKDTEKGTEKSTEKSTEKNTGKEDHWVCLYVTGFGVMKNAKPYVLKEFKRYGPVHKLVLREEDNNNNKNSWALVWLDSFAKAARAMRECDHLVIEYSNRY